MKYRLPTGFAGFVVFAEVLLLYSVNVRDIPIDLDSSENPLICGWCGQHREAFRSQLWSGTSEPF